jgi:hypothetical protein
MATTYDYSKVGGTADVAAIDIIDQSALSLIASDTSADGFNQSADYVLATGDSSLPFYVKVRINYDPKADAGFGTTHYSIAVTTTEIKVVDSVTEWERKVKGGIYFDLPGRGVGDVAELKSLVSTLFGLTFGSTDGSDITSTDVLTSLAHGVPSVYG